MNDTEDAMEFENFSCTKYSKVSDATRTSFHYKKSTANDILPTKTVQIMWKDWVKIYIVIVIKRPGSLIDHDYDGGRQFIHFE